MATVKLYFEPYPENDADGLIIEESVDGLGGWSEIEDIAAIGTFPDYISKFTTANATATTYWFRIAWKVAGVPQNYSEAVQVGELAPKYTTPDLVRDTTRLTTLAAAGTALIQELITQAYHMVQSACGPFDEANADFIEIAPTAMRLYVEYLYITQDPSALSAFTGVIEEKVGSYRYRRSEKAVEMFSDAGGEVPDNIKSLVCRFNLDDAQPVETITTSVFPESPYYDGGEEDLDLERVVTSADPDRTALDSDSYERGTIKKYPSV